MMLGFIQNTQGSTAYDFQAKETQLDILTADLSLTIIGLVMISTNSWIYKASFTKNLIASLKKFPPPSTRMATYSEQCNVALVCTALNWWQLNSLWFSYCCRSSKFKQNMNGVMYYCLLLHASRFCIQLAPNQSIECLCWVIFLSCMPLQWTMDIRSS